MIACTTYLCLSVLYGHIIIYHIPNTYNYIYVVVSSQSDLYVAADYVLYFWNILNANDYSTSVAYDVSSYDNCHTS